MNAEEFKNKFNVRSINSHNCVNCEYSLFEKRYWDGSSMKVDISCFHPLISYPEPSFKTSEETICNEWKLKDEVYSSPVV